MNIVDGGHILTWSEEKILCPYCGDTDNIIHSFEKCHKFDKMAPNMRTALKRSLDTTLNVYERVTAVRDLIGLDIERDNKSLTNSIITNKYIINMRIRIRVNDYWTIGTITNRWKNMVTL